jgi:hypothetical protein
MPTIFSATIGINTGNKLQEVILVLSHNCKWLQVVQEDSCLEDEPKSDQKVNV